MPGPPSYAPTAPAPADAGAGAGAGAERDRPAVHLIWEAFLGIVAVALIGVLLATEPGRAFTNVLQQAAGVGLAAAGLSLSLRTGTPNLAIGALAGFTGGLAAHLVTTSGWSVTAAMIAGVGAAVLIGILLGVLIAALSVPAWAATFGVATIMQAALIGVSDARSIVLPINGEFPTGTWFGLFLVVSIGGGALWLLPGPRRRLSLVRGPGEPGRWGGLWPGLGTLVGITGSSFLAGLAGVAEVSRVRIADPATGQFLTLIALAAVLLGGASVFGRRAGVTGTAAGVLVVVIGENLLILHQSSVWVVTLFVGLMVLVGLAVNRGIESITNALNAAAARRTPFGSQVSAPVPVPPPPPPAVT